MPHRRISFNLRGKVEEEIERLGKLDIIKKVSGPTRGYRQLYSSQNQNRMKLRRYETT